MIQLLMLQQGLAGAGLFLDEDGNVRILTVVLIIAVCAVVLFIKESFQKKAGENSEEKERVAEIVKKIAEGDSSMTAAYATFTTSDTDLKANRTTYRYWYFAIGFNKERIVVAPLQIADGKPCRITYKDSYEIRPEQLGLVNGKCSNSEGWAEFYDKEGNKIVTLQVQASYVKNNASEVTASKVTITQKEAAEKWAKEIVPYWMEKVNTANGTHATGYPNNSNRGDFKGRTANAQGGGKATNM